MFGPSVLRSAGCSVWPRKNLRRAFSVSAHCTLSGGVLQVDLGDGLRLAFVGQAQEGDHAGVVTYPRFDVGAARVDERQWVTAGFDEQGAVLAVDEDAVALLERVQRRLAPVVAVGVVGQAFEFFRVAPCAEAAEGAGLVVSTLRPERMLTGSSFRRWCV
jgi:hypothetical protein